MTLPAGLGGQEAQPPSVQPGLDHLTREPGHLSVLDRRKGEDILGQDANGLFD